VNAALTILPDSLPHVALEPRAIDCAERIIYSLINYGPVPPIAGLADLMPNPALWEAYTAATEATEQGARGYSDVLALVTATLPPAPAEQTRSLIMEAIDRHGAIAPSPRANAPAVDVLNEFRRVKRRYELAQELAQSAGDAERSARLIADLAAVESECTTSGSLRERAYAMRFDPSEAPPPDETAMSIGEFPIAARGNLSVIQGKSKVGKSALVSAVLAAAQRGRYQAQGDTLCVEWAGEADGAIIHLDTEQSRADWHGLVSRSVTRSGIPEVSPRLVSLPLVMFARSERLAILRETLAHERAIHGVVDCVIIDGVADLCASPNDEAESLELVSKLHALAQEFHVPIFCILHENPASEQGKTRGHLGSELNRKAFANLRIDKEADGLSVVFGTDMRKRDIPREQGFCFGWDDSAGMHVFKGRAAGIKAAEREAAAIAKAREEWEPIFEFVAANGTNGACPVLSVLTAAEAERDMNGTKNKASAEAMKKRLQRAESLGVLRKTARGEWALNQTGQTGHERDKRDLSRT
jgi:hypothetical protein